MAGILEEVIGLQQKRGLGEYAADGGVAPDTVQELERSLTEAERAEMAESVLTEDIGHVYKDGKDVYVDTAFINRVTGMLPGFQVRHLGFGEFAFSGPGGEIEFDRMRGKKFPGQSGRSHKIYVSKGDKKIVVKLVKAMVKKGNAQVVKAPKVPTPKAMAKKTGMRLSGKPTGKIQKTIMDIFWDGYDRSGQRQWVELADMSSMPGLRGVNLGKVMKSIEALVKKGLVDVDKGNKAQLGGTGGRFRLAEAVEPSKSVNEAKDADMPLPKGTAKEIRKAKLYVNKVVRKGGKVYIYTVFQREPLVGLTSGGKYVELRLREKGPGIHRGVFKKPHEAKPEFVASSLLGGIQEYFDKEHRELVRGMAHARMGKRESVEISLPETALKMLTALGEAEGKTLGAPAIAEATGLDKRAIRQELGVMAKAWLVARMHPAGDVWRLSHTGEVAVTEGYGTTVQPVTEDAKGNAYYETAVKPALRDVEKAVKKGDLKRTKLAIDVAVRLGATRRDLNQAVGGTKAWNKLVRQIKKAGLIRMRGESVEPVAEEECQRLKGLVAEGADTDSFYLAIKAAKDAGASRERIAEMVGGEENLKVLVSAIREAASVSEEVRPGQYFVLVDVSVPGGRMIGKKLYHGVKGADADAAKHHKAGRNVQVIDAVWYGPAAALLKSKGMIGESKGYKAKTPLEKMVGEMVQGQSGKWLSKGQMGAIIEALNKKGITEPSKGSHDDIAREVGKMLSKLMKGK